MFSTFSNVVGEKEKRKNIMWYANTGASTVKKHLNGPPWWSRKKLKKCFVYIKKYFVLLILILEIEVTIWPTVNITKMLFVLPQKCPHWFTMKGRSKLKKYKKLRSCLHVFLLELYLCRFKKHWGRRFRIRGCGQIC